MRPNLSFRLQVSRYHLNKQVSILRVTPKINPLLHLKLFFNPVHESLAPALLILILQIDNLVLAGWLGFFPALFSHLFLFVNYVYINTSYKRERLSSFILNLFNLEHLSKFIIL